MYNNMVPTNKQNLINFLLLNNATFSIYKNRECVKNKINMLFNKNVTLFFYFDTIFLKKLYTNHLNNIKTISWRITEIKLLFCNYLIFVNFNACIINTFNINKIKDLLSLELYKYLTGIKIYNIFLPAVYSIILYNYNRNTSVIKKWFINIMLIINYNVFILLHGLLIRKHDNKPVIKKE